MKNKYETVIIANENTEIKDDLIMKMQVLQIEIIKFEELGVKKLAYELSGQIFGKYYDIYIKCDAKQMIALERYYRIKNEILKFMTVKIEED